MAAFAQICQEPQRLYVGGIDPDRLPVDEVFDRLERHLCSHGWKLGSVHFGSCYFQASIVDRTPGGRQDDDEYSYDEASSGEKLGFKEAKKLLHNVKWKGCKLKVEQARPHFLERLVLEQQNNNNRLTTIQPNSLGKVENGNDVDIEHKLSEPLQQTPVQQDLQEQQQQQQSGPRRHYRIRRGHGETVWHVDTRPYQVTDIESFGKLRSKLQRKQQHQDSVLATSLSKQQREAMGASAQNPPSKCARTRAIHLRFSDHQNSEHRGNQNESTMNQSSLDRSKILPVQETSVVALPKDTVSIAATSDVDESNSQSVSDGRDSESDPKLTSTVGAEFTYMDEKHDSVAQTSSKTTVADSSSSEASEQESMVNEDDKNSNNETANQYAWSTDEDDEDDNDQEDSEVGEKTPGKQFNQKWNPMDEFSMGNAIAETSQTEGTREEEETGSYFNKKKDDDELGFDKEEESNLNILSKLFPDLAVGPDKSQSIASRDSKPDMRKTPRSTAGWSVAGEMLRFDPAKQSSQQFILKDDKNDDNEDDEEVKDETREDNTMTEGKAAENELVCGSEGDKQQEEEDNDDDDESTLQKDKHATTTTTAEDNDPVYRQGELEAVFREARQEEAAIVVLESAEAAKEETPGGFSFSFNVGNQVEPSIKNDQPQATMRVWEDPELDGSALDLGSAESPVYDSLQEQPIGGKKQGVPRTEEEGKASSLVRKRRFDSAFSREELDRYARAFYEFGDGKRIMEDIEGYRKDPEVHKSWDEQRKALTLDWKRKRKAAVARRRNSHHHHHHQQQQQHYGYSTRK